MDGTAIHILFFLELSTKYSTPSMMVQHSDSSLLCVLSFYWLVAPFPGKPVSIAILVEDCLFSLADILAAMLQES